MIRIPFIVPIFASVLSVIIIIVTFGLANANPKQDRQLRRLNRQLQKLDQHHINRLDHQVDRIFRRQKRRNERAGKKLGQALGKAIAAGILGAAVAHHHRNDERYWHHAEVSDRENAIGVCVHHANKIVKKSIGGLYAQLDRVKRVKERGWHQFVVRADITGVYRFGDKTSHVVCKTEGHRVVSFKYN